MIDKRQNAWDTMKGVYRIAIVIALLVMFMIMMIVVIIKLMIRLMTTMMIRGTSVKRKLWL